jgi:hypothetical protein
VSATWGKKAEPRIAFLAHSAAVLCGLRGLRLCVCPSPHENLKTPRALRTAAECAEKSGGDQAETLPKTETLLATSPNLAPRFARVRVGWVGLRLRLRNKGSKLRCPELHAGNGGRWGAIDDCIWGSS